MDNRRDDLCLAHSTLHLLFEAGNRVINAAASFRF
ncbi:hypothetical protein ABIC60_001371 [Phyllobacterium ifriqiyense]